MKRGARPGSGRGRAGAAAGNRLLLIGPAPHREGGARLSFEIMLDYVRGLPNLSIERFDLPVHHPLYREDGLPGPLSHRRTVMAVLCAAGRIPRVDKVILFGSSDVCFSYGLVLMLCAKLFRKHFVTGVTGGRAVFDTRLLPAFVRSVSLFTARVSDVVLTETEVARNDLPEKLRSKAVAIGGFRPRPPPVPRPVRRPAGAVSFAFVGRAPPDDGRTIAEDPKGLDVLLDAIDRIRTSPARKFDSGSAEGIEFHAYGPASPGLAERIRRTPGMTAHGFMANDRLREALRQHDVLVFPSRYALEGHPGVVMEAFMAGLPVIASDLPGPSEIVRHEVNGLVVGTGDPDALARAVARLATDRALRRRLAAGARASASGFDQDRVLPRMAEALGLLPATEVLAPPGPAQESGVVGRRRRNRKRCGGGG